MLSPIKPASVFKHSKLFFVKKRTQLTLFVDQQLSAPIERIRLEFNPVQFALINSHVTLCRENELEDLERVMLNLKNLKQGCITIELGNPIRFLEGKGVMLPAIGDYAAFQKLRKNILHGLIENPRNSEPHITLLHPRNATCTDEIFEQIRQTDFPRSIDFCKISLIEQKLGKAWRVLEEFNLSPKNPPQTQSSAAQSHPVQELPPC